MKAQLACIEITKAAWSSATLCYWHVQYYVLLQPYVNSSTLYTWSENIIVATVAVIDNALYTNDYKTLCNLMYIEECEDLIGESFKSETADGPPQFSAEGLVNVESDVQVKYASVFHQYKEKLDEDFEYPCSSCERLHNEKSYVTKYTADTKKLSSAK